MTTRATVPFLAWKSEVRDAVISARAYPSAEWFDRTQSARLSMMYDTGETIESATETIAAFGRGELDNQRLGRSLSPLALARKWLATKRV